MKHNVVFINIVMTVHLFPAILMAIMSPMINDHPNFYNYILSFLVGVLPIVIIVTQIISWNAISKQNYSFALKINALPVLNVLIIIIISIISTYV